MAQLDAKAKDLLLQLVDFTLLVVNEELRRWETGIASFRLFHL